MKKAPKKGGEVMACVGPSVTGEIPSSSSWWQGGESVCHGKKEVKKTKPTFLLLWVRFKSLIAEERRGEKQQTDVRLDKKKAVIGRKDMEGERKPRKKKKEEPVNLWRKRGRCAAAPVTPGLRIGTWAAGGEEKDLAHRASTEVGSPSESVLLVGEKSLS